MSPNWSRAWEGIFSIRTRGQQFAKCYLLHFLPFFYFILLLFSTLKLETLFAIMFFWIKLDKRWDELLETSVVFTRKWCKKKWERGINVWQFGASLSFFPALYKTFEISRFHIFLIMLQYIYRHVPPLKVEGFFADFDWFILSLKNGFCLTFAIMHEIFDNIILYFDVIENCFQY